ncbi:hypothetical protein L3476_02100 [Paenibacillus thiaminolyticus]|uniref:hypothetical protein n=1 Tax=Paenibacillus thiaminolyticus TaxID=49283 RepID=UPI0013F5D4AB|nr:hypothetical protein [Paenibacillus thiaminolyticus]NGP57218.1 hypothetical protein [Paenibacillus thiaminolyticus]WCR27595.1 hypothetical protein L3476_02100 [Paenibacillus thiaminolyticus]
MIDVVIKDVTGGRTRSVQPPLRRDPHLPVPACEAVYSAHHRLLRFVPRCVRRTSQ